MAVIGGQTDRFGNKIPPNQSVKVFINADGTVPQQREIVSLPASIVATDDPVTQATALSLSSAATNAISLATTVTAGLIPASKMVQLNYLPVLIDDQTVSAVNTFTTAAWSANLYEKIIFEFIGTYNGYLTVQANADATPANYLDIGQDTTCAAANIFDTAYHSQGSARVGIVSNPTNFSCVEGTFFVKTTGRGRPGMGKSHATSSTAATSTMRNASFSWEDTATNITFLTFGATGATITGRFRIWGV